MWDVLLAMKEEVKQLTGSIMNTKAVLLQNAYMGTHRTKITVHEMSMDITEPCGGRFRQLWSSQGCRSGTKQGCLGLWSLGDLKQKIFSGHP